MLLDQRHSDRDTDFSRVYPHAVHGRGLKSIISYCHYFPSEGGMESSQTLFIALRKSTFGIKTNLGYLLLPSRRVQDGTIRRRTSSSSCISGCNERGPLVRHGSILLTSRNAPAARNLVGAILLAKHPHLWPSYSLL